VGLLVTVGVSFFGGVSPLFPAGKVYVKRKDLGTAIEYYNKAQMEFATKDVERLIKTTQLDKKKLDAKMWGSPRALSFTHTHAHATRNARNRSHGR